MLKIRQCLDCGTKLSQESWAPELCPRCSLQLALEQSPVEIDVGDDPEALPTRQFPNDTFSPGQILGQPFPDPLSCSVVAVWARCGARTT